MITITLTIHEHPAPGRHPLDISLDIAPGDDATALEQEAAGYIQDDLRRLLSGKMPARPIAVVEGVSA